MEDYEEDLNDDDDNNDECYLVKKKITIQKNVFFRIEKKEADRLKQSSMNGGGYVRSGVYIQTNYHLCKKV